MAPTPSSRSNLSTTPSSKSHHSRTPFSKRLHFTKETTTTTTTPMDHPVEVITRIRNHTDVKTLTSLQINPDGKSLRLKTEIGYRDFSLDGVSSSEEDDIDGFYKRFVESRINGVKTGNKCTIMVYGPTGSGKSHTMFGCAKQPGIVYRSLKEILGEGDGERLGVGVFVQVTVLEIYNEEIYDLLPSGNVGGGGGGFGPGWPKGGSATKVKLEVMGKKAKNATFISGNEAGKILKEIQKVEKRRTVKSTLCNERSSRSHCMIIVDVPTVGGQLMLVDMAGSENIDQAGQTGLEAKLQTAKINQGNIALKRVVESIANGDSHVPFRDSKLTMLLQDSFEDDKSKILMILCASPDPKELHKTIATLEYGAKAKCIIRGAHTPTEDKGGEDSTSAVVLGSRIAALDQFICKLQLENKLKEKECNEALKKLKKKEEEVSILRAKLAVLEERGKEVSEDEINAQVNKRIQMMESEIETKIRERERINSEFVEIERKTMEERIFQQQQEIERLSRKLEENESEVHLSGGISASPEIGGSFMKKLRELSTEESDMVKSMDLDNSIDLDTNVVIHGVTSNFRDAIQSINGKACLTTVYEEEECENEEESDKENVLDEEVQKEVIEEETSSRELRIQNIFTLCGNYRELSQEKDTPMFASSNESSEPRKYVSDDLVVSDNLESWNNSGENKVKQLKDSTELASDLKENHIPFDEKTSSNIEIYLKWEASKENPGQFVTTLKVAKDSTLADLRKLVEIHLGGEQQGFTFLTLEDPSGAPVAKEKEAATKTSKLPICNNKTSGRLACLRPLQRPARVPFSSLENNLVTTTPNSHFLKKSDSFFSSPILSENLRSSPSVMVRSS